MCTKITQDVLESFLKCHYKAHLKSKGQIGIVSEFERLLLSSRQAVTRQAIDKILARTPDVVRDIHLTAACLRKGHTFILNATLNDEMSSLRLDGLKRLTGPSELGGFYYVPMLFYEGHRVRKEQRQLL